jgi:AcrR family transcriptional regulator
MPSRPAAGRARPTSTTASAQPCSRCLPSGATPALSLESVATTAGVTRPTIYRRWPGKAALVTGVLAQTVPALAARETDNALRDLCNMVVDFVCALTTSEYAPAVLALHAQARHDPELAVHLRDSYLAPRASTLGRMIARAIDQGHLAKSLPKRLIRDMLFGPPTYRWLIAGEPVDDDTARALVAAAIAGLNQAVALQLARNV